MMAATQTAVQIRLAEPADIPELFLLLQRLNRESVLAQMHYEPDFFHLSAVLTYAMAHPEEQYVAVADYDGQLIGLICAGLLRHHLLPLMFYVMEWAFYVTPLYRRSKIAWMLWHDLAQWAKVHGAHMLVRGRYLGGNREQYTWQRLEP